MEQRLKNRLERAANLTLYFQQTQARWDAVPALKTRITYFLTEQAKLPIPPPDADRDNAATTGARPAAKDAKDTARFTLATRLVPVAASLHLWLTDPAHLPADPAAADQQRLLAAQLDIRRPSKLATMATLGLLGLTQLALDALSLVPPADLADFDLTAADVTAFEDAAALFGLRRNLPKATAQQLAREVLTHEEKLDALEEYVDVTLSKAVDTRRAKDPDFVRGFKQAYQLIDKRATRTTPPKNNPNPPSNP